MDFKVITRKMPGRPNDPVKYYATIVRPNNVSLEVLAKRIAEISTVSELDTQAVLNALTRVLPEYLSTGATVELGNFGRFMVNISSNGAETEEDFSKELIKGNKVSYHPGSSVKEVMENVHYNKK